MKLFIVLIAAFAGLAAARGKCCSPGCGSCSDEDCGQLGDNDCSNNRFYVSCCDESKQVRDSLAHPADNGDSKTSKAQ